MEQKRAVNGRNSAPETPTKPSKKKAKLDCDDKSTVPSTSIEMSGDSDGERSPSDVLNQAPHAAPGWFVTFFADFENRMENTIDALLCKRLGELSTRIDVHDNKITSLEMEVEAMKKTLAELQEENSSCKLLIDDLENRSRRNNLVFHGVPEVGEKEDCWNTMSDVLQKFVGLSSNDYSIERVHRTPTKLPPAQVHDPKAQQGQHPQGDASKSPKPRIIHVCFSSFSQKEKVRSECVKKFKGENYHGNKLYVAEDYSRRVRQLRKNRMEQMKSLRSQGKNPFFLFPAKIAYRESSGKLKVL